MSILTPDLMPSGIFDHQFNSPDHDQSFFTQAFPPNKGNQGPFDEYQAASCSATNLDYLHLGTDGPHDDQCSFSNAPRFVHPSTDLDQFLPESEFATPGGTLTFSFPGPVEVDPRLILQNNSADGNKTEAYDLKSSSIASMNQSAFISRQYVSPPHQRSSFELVKESMVNPKSNAKDTTVRHGQLTPDNSLSPTGEVYNTDTPDTSKSRSKNPKRNAGPDRKAVGEEVPKPKRGRRSKKAKTISKEEQQAQREKFLERNRNAAAKCRINKKQWQEGLKDKVKELGSQHAQRSAEFAQLQQEYDSLRAFLIPHSRLCPSKDLQNWVEAHAHSAFPRSPPIALSSNIALTLDQTAEDPTIARVNADYTGKRDIHMSSPLGGLQAFLGGIERPRSVPGTPSAGDVKLGHHLRANSISTPGALGTTSASSKSDTIFFADVTDWE
ncbi:MAG: hypothetical protein M1818_001438 [Claussenomyces sp. TS43310]|nr:MAG: hypothetical protein M1818_001438 [Claussenomyces sp. TS43310]